MGNFEHRVRKLEQQAADTFTQAQIRTGYRLWIDLHQEAYTEIGVPPTVREELRQAETQALDEACRRSHFPMGMAVFERFEDTVGERWVAAMRCCLAPDEQQAFQASMEEVWDALAANERFQYWKEYYGRHAKRT